MKVYKRSLGVLLKSLVSAPCAALFVYLAASFFTSDIRILYGLPILIFLALFYLAVFSENIRFELDGCGRLKYFQKGRLKQTFHLEECAAGYRQNSTGGFFGSHDITLEVLCLTNGQATAIDCSPIGLRRFERMYEEIKEYADEEPEIIRAVN